MSLKSMRYFNKAVGLGSITKAAEELNIAASAISAAIDQVEEEFQLKLLNRFRSRGIVPTASGRIMQRKFAHLLEEFEAVISEGAELKQALQGELKIGYYAPMSPAFLPKILKSLSTPDVTPIFHLEECDNTRAQDGFLAGEFDVILFVSNGASPQIEFDELLDAPAYCLTRADHRFTDQTSVDLSQLSAEPLILLNRPLAFDYYRQILDRAAQTTRTITFANSVEMVRSMVGAGHGIAVLNMLPSTDISYGGDRLAALPISDPLPSLTVSLGYDKTNPRRIVKQFVQLCQKYFDRPDGTPHILAFEGRHGAGSNR